MRETVRTTALAGLAVLAVALAAATLDSTVVPEPSGQGGPGPGGIGGEGGGGLLPVPRSGPPPAETVQIPFLSELLAVLATVLAVAVVVYAFRHWRRTLAAVLAAFVLLVLAYVLSHLVSVPALPARSPMPEPGNGSVFGGGGGGGSETTRPTPPSLVLLFVFCLALLGAVVALRRSTGEDGEETTGESSDGDPDVAAVGRAAGRAADRLEAETDTTNEVYRTWREMTELLHVDDPRTSTPGEFAAGAVDAGLGREDVAELTRLFEDVRYGETQPSEEDERRAVAVFRRIEDRYAGEEGP